MFIVLLHRTTRYVIPRRGVAPTWESPGTLFVSAVLFDGLYQEIAPQAFPSVPRRMASFRHAPRNDSGSRWSVASDQQNDKLKFEFLQNEIYEYYILLFLK